MHHLNILFLVMPLVIVIQYSFNVMVICLLSEDKFNAEAKDHHAVCNDWATFAVASDLWTVVAHAF